MNGRLIILYNACRYEGIYWDMLVEVRSFCVFCIKHCGYQQLIIVKDS